MDDKLVKSAKEDYHLENLWKMFETLRHYDMKLTPRKCVFGVLSEKFLSFMVS